MAGRCSNKGRLLLFGVSKRPFVGGTIHESVLSHKSCGYCFLRMVSDMLKRADGVLVLLLSDEPIVEIMISRVHKELVLLLDLS